MRLKLLSFALMCFSYLAPLQKSIGQTEIVMSNTTITTCNADLLYPASGKYLPNKNIVMTITPATPGNLIDLTFSKFDIDEEGDYLTIYDGASITAPVIGSFSGQQLPERIIASNPTGKLTLKFYSDSEFEATGFKTHISCFDPLLPPLVPTNLIGYSAAKRVTLKWKDNSVRETGFRIQRSLNKNNSYKTIAFLGPDVTSYQDFNTSLNTTYYYKVAAYNASAISDYTVPVQVKTGPEPTIMQTGTISTCNAVFLDPGGYNNYSNNLNLVTTINPGISGKRIQACFQDYELNPGSDFLYIYDGPNTSSPLIYGGVDDIYTKLDTVVSTHATGALTFKFTSSDSYTLAGWIATINCLDQPPAIPSNLTLTVDGLNKVNLKWTDNSANEGGFIIEKSQPSNEWYYPIATVPANTTTFVDPQVFSGGVYYYRIRSYNQAGGKSLPSNEKVIAFPIIMAGGMTSVCGVSFSDPGGFGNYANNSNIQMTLGSYNVPGSKLSIKFTSFDTEKNHDFLKIYDGLTTSAPLIGSFSGNTLPPVLTATNADGALTFVFTSDAQTSKSGWTSLVTCVAPAASGSQNTSQRKMDESSIRLEKEVNVFPNPAYGSFKIQLPQHVKWTEINMFDSEGTKRALINGGIKEPELEIDVRAMKKGIYIIELIGIKNVIHKRVFIK